MATQVTYLHPRERIWLDPARLGLLYAEFGASGVQDIFERAMQELESIHNDLAIQYSGRDLIGFSRSLRRLRRISAHMGLICVTRIAGDVDTCLARQDATALAATWSRLARSVNQARLGPLGGH